MKPREPTRAMEELGHDYNPFVGPERDDPYPTWARARHEAPVFFSEVEGVWVITRYADIRAILQDTERFSSRDVTRPAPAPPEVEAVLRKGYAYEDMPALVGTDPPAHIRLRRVTNAGFTPERVTAMEPHIRNIANELIDAFVHDGKADLLGQFAYLLPATVVMELLGVPREDRGVMKRWSDDRALVLWGKAPLDQLLSAAHAFVEMQRYCAKLIEARRADPRDDLISVLATTRLDDHEPLSTSELVGQVTALISAGHETTTNLIAHAVLLLLRHPEAWAAVRADFSLIPAVIDEALRINSPVRGMLRTTTQDVEVAGVRIPAGAQLQLMYSAANHDETVFPDPDRFDIHRQQHAFHLAFGHGIHFCVGAALARLEARITLELFATRLPNLRLQPGHALHYVPNAVFYSPTDLPVLWDAAG